jgi:hypothetical protein
MEPVWVPGVSPITLTETVTFCDAPDDRLPELTFPEIQEGLNDADHDSVPVPVFSIVTVWSEGFGPPSGAVHVREAGLTPMRGVALMCSVTVQVWGEFDAAGSLNVRVPV